ncbi:GNAT family N-acetyltransferase [Nocardioides jishulii]|uniref:GNAT family N-acetyltransferase n=1 Tax=Nocardioides jishulii TaxID=2575440 RepID=A0A4U2YUG0_9ACTN|nr:GNAT family protein [Nocardioides jishulii]QCX28542.1 GNAT family N-acetyltransferase [Nocardioides jishulii]TKI64565.1 GNAT family N-acetyltransferase [Nocardioides jishulii]
MAQGWPAVLVDGPLRIRPIARSDGRAWMEARSRNRDWLERWEATVPAGTEPRPSAFNQLVRRLHRSAKLGTTMPFVIEVGGSLVGQVTVNNIVRGSAQSASVGYWIDQAVAGHGLMPHSVALVIDHCFTTAGLHRIEICIRPENTNSLRVVEKLQMREVGLAPRYLHIDGDWRDHRIYAVTKEEVPDGMLARLRSSREIGPPFAG